MRTSTTIPDYGTRRIVTKFLWLPLAIYERQDKSITVQRRWLERVSIQQQWTRGRITDFWKNLCFLDRIEK